MITHHRTDAARVLPLPGVGRGLWAGLTRSARKGRRAAANLAEDIVILGQFAFGREYYQRPAS